MFTLVYKRKNVCVNLQSIFSDLLISVMPAKYKSALNLPPFKCWSDLPIEP